MQCGLMKGGAFAPNRNCCPIPRAPLITILEESSHVEETASGYNQETSKDPAGIPSHPPERSHDGRLRPDSLRFRLRTCCAEEGEVIGRADGWALNLPDCPRFLIGIGKHEPNINGTASRQLPSRNFGLPNADSRGSFRARDAADAGVSVLRIT